jgi:hypothetical protein
MERQKALLAVALAAGPQAIGSRRSLRLPFFKTIKRKRTNVSELETTDAGLPHKHEWGAWKIIGYTGYLGIFKTAESAALEYDRAAKEKWGEFARLNFPVST